MKYTKKIQKKLSEITIVNQGIQQSHDMQGHFTEIT